MHALCVDGNNDIYFTNTHCVWMVTTILILQNNHIHPLMFIVSPILVLTPGPKPPEGNKRSDGYSRHYGTPISFKFLIEEYMQDL